MYIFDIDFEKKRKNIFTVFNLILFSSSLLFSTLNSFAAAKMQFHSGQSRLEVNATQTNEDGSCSQLLGEEVETESEHDLHVQALVLPFSIACINLEIPQFSRVSAQPLAEKLSNPIYISVCDFRI